MRINSLHIYGFGQLRDTNIILDKGINIIEGYNEAGKSTIMAFIQAIIFGFEGRRAAHLRYEPIAGGKFGGAINFIDNNGIIYRVERIYFQRVTGDVKVYLPNGEIAGEEYIPTLIGKVSDKVFKQIFSFGLTELQQIESLADNEINDFIYHAGTGSVNQILDLKQFLEQKQQKLYKNGGKNPEINSILAQMESQLDEIEGLKRKHEQHSSINERMNLISNEIEQIENKISNYKAQLTKTEKILNFKAPYKRVKLLEAELKEYPDNFSFPENGVDRLNILFERKSEIELEIEHIDKRMTLAEGELNQLEYNSIYLEKEYLLTNNRDELTKYKELIAKKASLTQEQKYITESIADYLSQFGPSFDEEKILSLEISINDKQYLQDLANKIQTLEKQWDKLTQEQDIKKSRIVQLEKAINKLQQETDQQDKNANIKSIYPITKKLWQAIQENKFKLSQLQEQKEFYFTQAKATSQGLQLPLVVANILFYLVSALLLFFKMWSVGGAFLVLSFTNTILLYATKEKGKSAKKATANLKQIENQINLLENELNKLHFEANKHLASIGFGEINQTVIDELEALYNRTLEAERYITEKENRVADYLIELETIKFDTEQLENLELRPLNQQLNKLKFEWEAWLTEHNFDSKYSPQIVYDLILSIQTTKQSIKKAKLIDEELEQITKEIVEFSDKVNQTAEELNVNPYLSIEQKVQYLYDNLKTNQNIKAKYDNLMASLSDMKQTRENSLTRLSSEEKKINDLLNFASAIDKEDFYRLAARFKGYQALVNEQREILLTIESNCLNGDEYQQLIIDLNTSDEGKLSNEIQIISAKIKDYSDKVKDLLEEKGSLTNQLNVIENDQKLSQLNQDYINLQSELKTKTKELLTINFTKAILEASMKVYETEKQPKVIKQASEYFKKMTDNKYINIVAPIGSSEIEVIREDLVRFLPQFLSRGTVEQLFLAMRFALVKEFSKQLSLPIIMDDIFVNFDYLRLDNTIDVLNDLSHDHQILLFTCHQHVTSRIQKKINNINHIYLGASQLELDTNYYSPA